jgi:putative ABC transport system permease protein
MIKDYFSLALTNVKKRKLRSILTMIGIFIGIAAIVGLISLSGGLRSAIQDQFIQLGSNKLVVQAAGGGFGPPGAAVSNPLTQNDKRAIEKAKGVDLAVGRLIRTVQIEADDEVRFTYAVSIPKDTQERNLVMEANDYNIFQGRFFERDNAFEVVIGSSFAENFFDKPIELRDRIAIQGRIFKVSGILEKSGNPQQDSTLVMAEGTMRQILNIDTAYDIIPLQIQPGEDIDTVAERVSKKLLSSRNVVEGKEDFTVETPQQLIATLNNILLIIQGVLVGIAAISLVIGAIGIMNTMYTAVVERTKEIGILKAIGATRNKILILFLIESGILGTVGGAIGVLLGFGISKGIELIAFQIYQTPLIQAEFSYTLLFGTLLFSFLLGAISGVLPARQAASLEVVEALRK